jgi:hypothetical protein
MNKNYTKLYTLTELYTGEIDDRIDKWEHVTALVNTAIRNRSYIRISDDNKLVSAVYNRHDSNLTLIIIDNNGHTNIVQTLDDLSNVGYSDPQSLCILLETDLSERIEKILTHYSSGSYSFDHMAMATRLAELGEGK